MSKKGFTTIGFTLIMPVIFILSLSGFWILWLINSKHQLNNLCHYYLLKAQDELINGNEKVLYLNSIANRLYMQKKSLEALILVAPPQIKMPAKIQRRIVIVQQKALATKQMSIFKIYKYKSQSPLYEFRRKFSVKLNEIIRIWGQKQKIIYDLNIIWKKSQLAIKRKDIASTYYRKIKHENLQSIRAKWSIPIRILLPDWVKSFVPIQKLWIGECASHPHKGGLKWVSNIGKGNH